MKKKKLDQGHAHLDDFEKFPANRIMRMRWSCHGRLMMSFLTTFCCQKGNVLRAQRGRGGFFRDLFCFVTICTVVIINLERLQILQKKSLMSHFKQVNLF